MASFPPFSISADTLSLINILITLFVAVLILKENSKIGEIKFSNLQKETSFLNEELDFKNDELEFKRYELDFKEKGIKRIESSAEEISNTIARHLINNPTWLDKFMDETGATYGGSVFGTRINHFYYEKKALAKKVIDVLLDEMESNKQMKYCILIDSGTTTYHIFCEICERIKGENKLSKERMFIITNNLPGIQYLMKHCKDGYDEYADLQIKCLLIPGEPLPVYGAVTGFDAIDFLDIDHIRKRIRDELKVSEGEYKIISFIPSNYMVRHPEKSHVEYYCPVARGGGHFEIKSAFANLSDKIYLISPLTKYSFATCDDLNKINHFTINEVDEPDKAKKNPNQVQYREIDLVKNGLKGRCTFFITDRKKDIHHEDLFWEFSKELYKSLKNFYGDENIKIVEYDIESWIPVGRDKDAYKEIELIREIPHINLRKAYNEHKKSGEHYIWSTTWVYRNEEQDNKQEVL